MLSLCFRFLFSHRPILQEIFHSLRNNLVNIFSVLVPLTAQKCVDTRGLCTQLEKPLD